MPTLNDIMTELKKLGSEQQRKTYARHGAPPEMFGVKVGDLKKVARKIKNDHELAMELYDTGNVDAMYLAGIVASGSKMNKKQLDDWAKASSWYMISEYTLPGVACENEHARELALKWIDSKKPSIACSGWSTYSGLVATQPDSELDLKEIQSLLDRVVQSIDQAHDRVRYSMNSFVIAVGTYVKPLSAKAKAAAKKLGTVTVDMGDTSCKVPHAVSYIEKVEKMGVVGKKRKTARC